MPSSDVRLPPPPPPTTQRPIVANSASKDNQEQSLLPRKSEFSEESYDSYEEESVHPDKKGKKKRRGQSADVEGRRNSPVINSCCCDCFLSEGVSWIASLECIWGMINLFVCASILTLYNSASRRLRNGRSPNEFDDMEWKKYGDAHGNVIAAALALHIFELIASFFLIAAASRRIRSFCFFWIASICLISVGETVAVALDPFSVTYALVFVIPIRAYYVYVVWCLSVEILHYPNGIPVHLIVKDLPVTATIVTRPGGAAIVPPSYYGYYSPYYGYGHPYYGYPYYGANAAMTGVVVGTGVGLALSGGFHDHHHYDGGYYDNNFG